jgi:hypothetical protein
MRSLRCVDLGDDESVTPGVTAVSRDGGHRFSMAPVDAVMLPAGLGLVGDAHAGATVQHR